MPQKNNQGKLILTVVSIVVSVLILFYSLGYVTGQLFYHLTH